MPKFKRYRDSNGAEFTSAVSNETAQAKRWTDITSPSNPAVGSDGKPLRDKPADRKAAAKKATSTPATTNTPKEG